MLHAKYQGSRLGGFRQKYVFYVFTICKSMLERMYDQGMPHSQTAYKPTAPRGRVKEQ